MIRVVLLGASGSIGQQTIKVLKAYPKLFKLVGFSVNQDLATRDKILKSFSNSKSLVTSKSHNLSKFIKSCNPTIVLNAISGTAGLNASIITIKSGVNLALANKESLVMAGDLLINLARKYQVKITPVDSEHNAIYQLLKGVNIDEVKTIVLTASGGPFYKYSKKQLANVTVDQALKHPTWKMGKKITVDSATLVNKGLEIIEAHHLFGIDYNNIKVMINRTSIVHSLVEFKDGSYKAHLGKPSMEVPILNSIHHKILKYSNELDLGNKLTLELEPIKITNYKAIELAYKVGNLGKEYPLVYCVSNELAVAAFLNNKIKFLDIISVIEKVIKNYNSKYKFSIKNLEKIETEVKQLTLDVLAKIGGKS